jgi:hypothetical protein
MIFKCKFTAYNIRIIFQIGCLPTILCQQLLLKAIKLSFSLLQNIKFLNKKFLQILVLHCDFWWYLALCAWEFVKSNFSGHWIHFSDQLCHPKGATTFNKTTLSITTLSLMTFSITIHKSQRSA